MVCAVAPHTGSLIVGRVLMGIGAALILPATLAIIPIEFSGREQITAFSVWMAVAGAGQALGPMIGGGLTQALGWPWIFYQVVEGRGAQTTAAARPAPRGHP